MPQPSRIALALALVAALGAPLLPAWLGAGLEPAALTLWQTLAVQVSFCGIAGAFAVSLGGSAHDRLGLVRGRLSASGLGLAIGGTLALSGALQFAVDALALAPGTSLERLDTLVHAAAPQHAWLLVLAFCVAPGFGEELLFRGAIQRSLDRAVGAWCIPVAALAFGALHLDLVHSPAAFVLGCALGAVARRSGSTWAAIACHTANNLAATLPQLGFGAALPQPRTWLGAAAWLALSGLFFAGAARSFPELRPPSATASA